jgi:hypothetical protein
MPYRDPEDRRRFDRERRRRERAEQRRPAALSAPLRLRVSGDVEALLTEAVEAVRTDPKARGTERARALVSVASVALRLIEAHDLHERLEALERVLQLRKIG